MIIKTMLLKFEPNNKNIRLTDHHGVSFPCRSIVSAERTVKELGYSLAYSDTSHVYGGVAMYTKYER